MHATAEPESDLYLPLPRPGERWHQHTIHTYYLGFHIPAERIGAYLYVRGMPAFPLSSGGVVIHRGTDNIQMLDAEFVDYEAVMPWLDIDGNRVTLPNGLSLNFVTPGEHLEVTYSARDGRCELDLDMKAVTPLVARRRLMPGEADHDGDPARIPGGAEQMMHVTGTLVLDGTTYEVDCLNPRDRSWSQVRTETRAEVISPPIAWSPACFGDDLAFNQFGIEAPSTNPMWKQLGLFPDVTDDGPFHHWGWILCDGELRELTSVRRTALDWDPALFTSSRVVLEMVDERDRTHRFTGEIISMTDVFGWPNLIGRDGVCRWESEDGRVAHAPYQEVWHDTYQRAMTAHRRAEHGEWAAPLTRR